MAVVPPYVLNRQWKRNEQTTLGLRVKKCISDTLEISLLSSFGMLIANNEINWTEHIFLQWINYFMCLTLPLEDKLQ